MSKLIRNGFQSIKKINPYIGFRMKVLAQSSERTITSRRHLQWFYRPETSLFTFQNYSHFTYFQQVKGMVDFHCYQVRSERSIRRFWIIALFTYVFAMYLRKMRNILEFVYQDTTNRMSFDQTKKELWVT